jgi:hypothetical protein
MCDHASRACLDFGLGRKFFWSSEFRSEYCLFLVSFFLVELANFRRRNLLLCRNNRKSDVTRDFTSSDLLEAKPSSLVLLSHEFPLFAVVGSLIPLSKTLGAPGSRLMKGQNARSSSCRSTPSSYTSFSSQMRLSLLHAAKISPAV